MSRRVSVNSHQRWRESVAGGPAYDLDAELLEEIPEPLHRRSEGEVSRLMAVLDEIAEKEGGDA